MAPDRHHHSFKRTEVLTNMTRIAATLLAVSMGIAAPVKADDDVTHYTAQPSDTMQEAVENFVTHNALMQEVLAKDELSIADMERVHELTYTIEIALARINEELGALPVVLEEVHLASEGDNPDALRDAAEVYLETARHLDR